MNLVLTVLAAYPLSRRSLKGTAIILAGIFISWYFYPGLIRTSLLVKDVGLLDTMWSLILPDAIAPFLLIILMTYIRGIPEELEEAAVVEGCSYWRILTRIVIPISKPVLATLTIFYAVGHWNQYFQALIYISDPDKYTLQLRLQIILELVVVAAADCPERTGVWIAGSGRCLGRGDRHSDGADRVDLSVLAKVLHQGCHAWDLDYLASEEGYRTAAIGIKGEHWEPTADGGFKRLIDDTAVTNLISWIQPCFEVLSLPFERASLKAKVLYGTMAHADEFLVWTDEVETAGNYLRPIINLPSPARDRYFGVIEGE